MQTQVDSLGIEWVWNRHWPWPIGLTLLVGLLLVVGCTALYFTERGRAGNWLRAFLVGLRVAAILLVVWMLAGWSIERYKSEMPELVIVMDDSASMQTADGQATLSTGRDKSATRWETAKQVLLRSWSNDQAYAREHFHPKLVTMSDEVRLLASDWNAIGPALERATAEGTQSRLGDGLIQILQRQSGRPTAALVLLSDGVVTSGAPLEEVVAAARRFNTPIITLAMGQQRPQPDLALVDLLADDAVYLGDRVNVQVTLSATDLVSHKTVVNLRDMSSGQVVDSVPVELTSAKSSAGVQLSFVPKSAGNSLIKLEVAAAPGEKNLDNNSIERVIDVRDQTLRVLMVQRTPSFEYRFLKTLLERTSNLADPDKRAFELDVVLQDADAAHVSQDSSALRLVPGDRATLTGYDCIVVGQVDASLIASSTQQLIVDEVTTSGCGLVFVCHPDFHGSELMGWPLGKLLPLDSSANNNLSSRTQHQWRFEGDSKRWQPTRLGESALPLQLVESARMNELWRSLPGPDWYYLPGKLKDGAQVLAIAAGNSDEALQAPLLISQFAGAGRVVMQTTDETYRWVGYRGSDLMYERYWIQMLRWLSRGKLNQQEQTELVVAPRQSQLGEAVQFSARLSADAAAALHSETCQVTLERMDGEVKVLELKRTQAASAEFKASDANLPSGSYKATLTRPQDAKVSSITFTITAPPGEQANLRSDWRALTALAEQTHGKFYTADQASAWLRELPLGSPVRRGSLPPIPLWNTNWVALLFVCLLTLEWILRRLANML